MRRDQLTAVTTMTDKEDLIVYEDGGCVVFCDRKNPNAWIRSDIVVRTDERAQAGHVSP